MARKSTDFDLGPHWHLDYRDLATLPEDRVVRVRFLVNTCASALTLILLTIVGWQLLARYSLAAQLHFWDEKVAAHQRDYNELQLVLRDYMTESDRIKDAYDVIYSPFVPSEFVLTIGRTLPDRMTVDMIGYADGMVTIRGNLAEPPEPASRVLGRYIEALRNDPQIGALFGDISARSLDRAKDGDLFNFEIVLKPH